MLCIPGNFSSENTVHWKWYSFKGMQIKYMNILWNSLLEIDIFFLKLWLNTILKLIELHIFKVTKFICYSFWREEYAVFMCMFVFYLKYFIAANFSLLRNVHVIFHSKLVFVSLKCQRFLRGYVILWFLCVGYILNLSWIVSL